MPALWNLSDFDDHEAVHQFTDRETGLRAIIAIHSTHRGPAMGGVRYWTYGDPAMGIIDALRLSRGMSYKNAMADLPLGGGKAVIIADPARPKDDAMLRAFGRAVASVGGRYVTAEDVGIGVHDIETIASVTEYAAGLPVEGGAAGGDPGPFTALGTYLGIKAAVKAAFGTDSVAGRHIAIQGLGSVGGNVAKRLAADGAKLTLADVNEDRARALASSLGGEAVAPDRILTVAADVFSPNALGAILDEQSIAALQAPVVAGAANNQLATADDGQRIHDRGIVYAPDYVINAGGIIDVGLEYLGKRDGQPITLAEVEDRIAQIPVRLADIWARSKTENRPASDVADSMARERIGRA